MAIFSIAFIFSGASIYRLFLFIFITAPVFFTISIVALKCLGSVLSINNSPPVATAIVIKVPVSILSGIIVCSHQSNFLTPSIYILFVPAPQMFPPALFKNNCKSTISGSFAGFSIIVTPFASVPKSIIFSVAPTLGKGNFIFVPCKFLTLQYIPLLLSAISTPIFSTAFK